MKILIIHNKYLKYGGEDSVFDSEKRLLEQNGNEVETLIFDNQALQGIAKLKMIYSIFYNNHSEKLLTDKIKTFQPQIIHVHNFFYDASPSIFYVANKYNIPVVQTLHNYRLICAGALLLRDNKPCELCINQKFPLAGIKHKCFGNSYLKTTQLTLMTSLHKYLGTWKEKITTYICLTEFAKSKIANSSLQIPLENITVKANCTEDVGYQHIKDNKREDFYLFIGRLSKEKGIYILLEAAKKSGCKLEIIGDGELKELVEKAAQMHPNIIYHGFQQKDFITNKLKTCKTLIFPSIWYEGMPLTILEAFSAGTPIIASDIDNINELITDNYNGVHFHYGNASDLAEKIQYFEDNFNNNFQNIAHLYTQARLTYEQKYTPGIIYKQLIAIYEKTIEKKKLQITISSEQ